jgi:hypothetical protein
VVPCFAKSDDVRPLPSDSMGNGCR